MKSIKYILLISTCLLLSKESQAEINLTFDISNLIYSNPTSHTPVELKPISNFNRVKFAAVCSLGGGGCSGISFGSGSNDINLDNAAQCRDEGFATSCGYGYVPDTSKKCPHNNSFFKCRTCSHTCNSGSLSYCSNDQVETGNSRNDCNETCYTCRSKTCEEEGYSSSINSCQNARPVSFSGKTCYTNITSKTCSDAGYSSAIPSNQECQSTYYCGNTCYTGCNTPSCSKGGYLNECPKNQICSTISYYGQTCYTNARTPSCSEGGYLPNIPANQICSAVTYYGITCHKDCYQPTCSAGGYLASIPTNQVCNSTTYYGRTCYNNCKNDACNSGYSKTICSGSYGTTATHKTTAGSTCYSCKTLVAGDIIFYDKTVSSSLTGKTPIGIVFDTGKRLAVSLTNSHPLFTWGNRGFDTSLLNCQGQWGAGADYSGASNTQTLISVGSFPAAQHCWSMSTAGTYSGEWFLPNAGEFRTLYYNRAQVNNGFSKTGTNSLANGNHWSSTEYHGTGAWSSHFYGGDGNQMQLRDKNDKAYVRCAIRF